jgi:hypothetical protein
VFAECLFIALACLCNLSWGEIDAFYVLDFIVYPFPDISTTATG